MELLFAFLSNKPIASIITQFAMATGNLLLALGAYFFSKKEGKWTEPTISMFGYGLGWAFFLYYQVTIVLLFPSGSDILGFLRAFYYIPLWLGYAFLVRFVAYFLKLKFFTPQVAFWIGVTIAVLGIIFLPIGYQNPTYDQWLVNPRTAPSAEMATLILAIMSHLSGGILFLVKGFRLPEIRWRSWLLGLGFLAIFIGGPLHTMPLGTTMLIIANIFMAFSGFLLLVGYLYRFWPKKSEIGI